MQFVLAIVKFYKHSQFRQVNTRYLMFLIHDFRWTSLNARYLYKKINKMLIIFRCSKLDVELKHDLNTLIDDR